MNFSGKFEGNRFHGNTLKKPIAKFDSDIYPNCTQQIKLKTRKNVILNVV